MQKTNNELPFDFLIEFQDKLRLTEEKFRNTDDVPERIRGLLKEIALFYNADYTFVMEVDYSLGFGYLSHTYHAEGLTSIEQEIISIPVNMLGGWAGKLRNNQPAIIDVREMKNLSKPDSLQDVWCHLKVLMVVPFKNQLHTGIIVAANPKVYGQNISFLSVVSSMIVSDMKELKLKERVEAVVNQNSKYLETDVFVSCFGRLEIRWNKGTLTDEIITADQCYRLFAYLLFNRKKTKPVREIADILWGDVPISDPYKDVKNVVYRLKRLLSMIELDDLVIGMGGTFIMNPKYQLHIDFERFDVACNRYFKENNPDVINKCFQTARFLYKGPLLPKCDHIHWFIPKITYFQSMYLQVLKKYLSIKWDESDYLTIQKIALEGLNDEPYDTDFIMYHILCMFRQGNRSLAMSYYKRVINSLTTEQKNMIQEYCQEQLMI